MFTPAGTAGYFESIGLPGALGYLTMLVEIAGGLALILGIKARIVSVALVPVLLGAAWFGHGGFGFNWSNPNGGWEYPVMWAIVQASLAALGDGAYALLPSSRPHRVAQPPDHTLECRAERRGTTLTTEKHHAR